MNIPIWLLLIAPPVFAIFGFLTCAVLTAGKVDDADALTLRAERAEANRDYWVAECDMIADASAAKSARIQTLTGIARSQQSIKSGRIIEVLEG